MRESKLDIIYTVEDNLTNILDGVNRIGRYLTRPLRWSLRNHRTLSIAVAMGLFSGTLGATLPSCMNIDHDGPDNLASQIANRQVIDFGGLRFIKSDNGISPFPPQN